MYLVSPHEMFIFHLSSSDCCSAVYRIHSPTSVKLIPIVQANVTNQISPTGSASARCLALIGLSNYQLDVYW
jgi:hypothetical protein